MRFSIFTAGTINRLTLLFSMVFLVALCFANEKQVPAKKNVLVVHSYHEGLSWTDGENRGIKDTLGSHKNIELFIEYLDSKRIPLADISETFTDFFVGKYNNVSFDAIVVSDDNALTFLAECHKSLFPDTPVIFCGVNNYKLDLLNQFGGLLTGVVQTLSPAGTINLIRKLQPDLERLVVVSGTTPTARVIRDQVKNTLSDMDTGLSVMWLDGFDTETLREHLSGLSKTDAVLLCNFNRDAKEVYYSHEESAVMISEVANAPVYAMEDDYLGTGVAGGYMNNSVDQGCVAAELCLEILNTGDVPHVNMNTPNRIMFDHDVMLRFDLDGDLLPSSTTFINKPLSFYQFHKNLIYNVILGFVLLLLAFLGVSYGLVHSRRAARKLRISEENLRTTLYSIGDAVITTDTKGKIFRMNPVAQQLTGWRVEDACGLALEEVFSIVNSHTHKPSRNPVEKVLESGEVAGLANHTELISKDGQRFQISDSAAPIKEADGNITGVVLVFRDVTDDYQIRQALQESERQYRLFAENAGDLIWTCQGRANNFVVSYINPAVEKILGYTQEEYLALPREKRIDAESLKVIDELESGMQPADSRTADIRHIHKDGHLIDCELWAKPLFDENGEMSGFQGRTIDISERKRAEMRLAEINTCLVGLGTDYDANVNALTALCGNLLGATCALYNRLQGGLLCSLGQWHTSPMYEAEDNPEGHICYDLIKRGTVEPFVVRNLQSTDYAQTDPNVSKYGLETYIGYPALCSGEIVGAFCVLYDKDVKPSGADLRILGIIASALAAEEDRKRAANELRRMQKLEELGTVAGGIAHDFNNLLSGIFGNLELAKMDLPENSPAGSYIQTAYSAIEAARGLTGQLLTFATGGVPKLGMVHTAELVRDSVDFNLHGSNIKVEYDLQEGLWPLEADKGQIGQVVANLVVNARQAMPDGGTLYVEAANLPALQQGGTDELIGDMVRITIRDQGKGIPAKLIGRIFDPYFSTKEEGHGLGLSVVNSIVKQHNGTIDVKAVQGVGTTFELCLPIYFDVRDAESVETLLPDDASEDKSALHILMMDDDPVIRQLSEATISCIGHSADLVGDGKTLLEKYSEAMIGGKPYDIVIMDLTIRGGMGGKEAVVKLLEIDPSARVIVASGYASDAVMANYTEYGFKGKLAKPYAMKELKKEILRVAGIA
ncbi:MAG: PAS domain S-box protein [Kiritimatiellae bacterium]|nr:PAS domain S-box protein [Kiritimatiellia bacterium]